MPEGITVATREDDPLALALTPATKVRHRQGALTAPDRRSARQASRRFPG